MILSIENIHQDSNNVIHVEAVIDDFLLVSEASFDSPAEYGPAVCEASFELDEDEILPDNENELIKFLDNLYLDWQLVEYDIDPYDNILL